MVLKGKAAIWLQSALIILTAVHLVFCLAQNPVRTVNIDFSHRYSEAQMVARGINPYDVWTRAVQVPGYTSLKDRHENVPDRLKLVHVHPPWAYTFMLPFTLFPIGPAHLLFRMLDLFCIFFIAKVAFDYGWRVRHSVLNGLFVAACALMTWGAIYLQLAAASNYSIIITAATLLMVRALNRNQNVVAGFLWAVVMLKPHTGVLFAIPLLLDRRFKTIAIAATVCLAASAVPMALTHTSLPELLRQTLAGGEPYFFGCGLMPPTLIYHLGIPKSIAVMIGLLLGGTLCSLASYALRKEKDWLVRMIPVVVISILWTVTRSHYKILMAVPLIHLACGLLSATTARSAFGYAVMILWFSVSLDGYLYWAPVYPFTPNNLFRMEQMFRYPVWLAYLFLMTRKRFPKTSPVIRELQAHAENRDNL